MFETYYFILGIINSLLLITIFLLAKFSDMSKLKVVGMAYLFLAIPALYGIIIAQQQQQPIQYSIFLGIFIAFLILEGLYDFVLKISFRENFRKYWKQLTPYLMLYWSMNYGFIIMTWRHSVVQGGIMLGLFVVQVIANMMSHTKKE
ncbi:hypothetical protein EVJ20_07025 [Exiguobacterium sp. SH0S1]|uniref:hypothetical protein n=1 Tax=unclassified Exiguobacterium TaxID=2644629 RepID=UPI001040A667|nr:MULTISPECIES: hypothetical protein [unclassified Exiguobacterium]TCI57251.1 hypothetical protein EVJ24_00300 [Exiguobacterium sp. SH1S21]TCI77707.1 hypothetical protein EVJ20_07025 [Exiguobacterium sp. SH0S1]